MRKSFISNILFFILSVFVLSGNVLAQSQASTGNIEGRILDPNGAAIPNVAIIAKNQDTGFEKNVNSNNDGTYTIILLPPGRYKVTTSAVQGFGSSSYENVPVNVGGKTSLEIALSLGGATNVVDVQATGEIVETTRTSISTIVEERSIINLPVNGRNFLDFATLTPGVIRDPTRAGDLAVGGQKGTLNSLQVDGVDNNNTFFGQSLGRTGTRPPYQFSIEAVKEFQINQNGFSAEFGRAGGAVINVVTKSGTNDVRGGGFFFFRDESLNSNTPLLTSRNASRPASQIKQFGGRIGGPIVKDRAFFFFVYDGQRANIPNVVDPPNFAAQSAAVRALLQPKINTYEVGTNQDVYLFKTDVNINEKNQFSLRFNQQNFVGNNNENAGLLSAEEHSGNSIARTTTLAGTLNSTFTSNFFNELRAQFARDKEPGEANSDQPEARIQTGNGFFTIGRNNFSPRETTIKRFQIIDNATYLAGNHTLKAGVDFNFDRIFNFFPGLFTGQYTFNGYAQFASNSPSAYAQNFAGAGTSGPVTRPNNSEYAVFGQDDWRVTPKFTLNLGLRYDYQSIAEPPIQNPNAQLLTNGFDTSFRPSDKNNVAPRIGASYGINDQTVIRGGYGIFYGRTPAIITGTSHSQNGIQVTGVSLNCVTQNCPIYPNIFASQQAALAANPNVSGVTPSLFFFARDYQQPLIHQARLAFEREILPNTSLTVSYLLFRGDNLTRTRDVNLGQPIATTATAFNGQTAPFLRFPSLRPNTSFARIQLFESTANSFYQGLAVEARRRLANRFSFIAAYTLSKAKDDKPDQTAVVAGADDSKYIQNQLDPRSEYGRSDLDVRHRFVFSPVYDTGQFKYSENKILRALLSDYVFSSILTLQSGFAYSALVSGDLNRDGNSNNDRAPGTVRNEFTTPNIYQLDLRASRLIKFGERYQITLLAEGFNLFNRSNISTVNNAQFGGFAVNGTTGAITLNSPSINTPFGDARSFAPSRQFQLGIKFDF